VTPDVSGPARVRTGRYAGIVKPFLLLATRIDDAAADDEYASFLAAGSLASSELERIRLEAAPMPAIDLDDYSGIIIGGSPFNASDPEDGKSAAQVRAEGELGALLDDVLERDYPLFGACYGVGLITAHLGGVVDGSWPEVAGAVPVALTPDGIADPLFGHLGERFEAFVGHKEACAVLPAGAVLLATGENCPVQAFRVGANVYATQFHPELTRSSILARLKIYNNNGYYDPESADDTFAAIERAEVTEPARLVKAFVERFATD
jgi:GMP synthase (glutamine-hydrolysing)